MRAAPASREAAVEHARHIGGGDAVAVVCDQQLDAAVFRARILCRAFEPDGLRAVLRRVLQDLADDEVGPFRIGEYFERLVDGELERDPCADERAGPLAARFARSFTSARLSSSMEKSSLKVAERA